MLAQIIVSFLIVTGIIYLIDDVFEPRLDWDKKNKQLFLWFYRGNRRENIKLYEQNRFN